MITPVEKINPKHTQELLSFLKNKSKDGVYRVSLNIGDKIVPIDVFPSVFPPDYTPSSKSVFEAFGNLSDLEVADIGCGTGVQSIVASLAGAKHVDSADINMEAIKCTEHNVLLNGLQNKISTFYSDLFSEFPSNKKYHLIIANLPFVNFDGGDDLIDQALYDNNFTVHKRFLDDARDFLHNDGIITLPHANLQSAGTSQPRYDFEVLEKMMTEYGYKIVTKQERNERGFIWINYKIKLI